MLSRADILKLTPQFPREEVQVPEWGGSVWVRTLSAAERDKLEAEWERTKRVNFRARLALYTLCDQNGVALMQEQDLHTLGNQASSALNRITEVAFRLNGFTKADEADLEKNSESGQTNGSATVSPHSSAEASAN